MLGRLVIQIIANTAGAQLNIQQLNILIRQTQHSATGLARVFGTGLGIAGLTAGLKSLVGWLFRVNTEYQNLLASMKTTMGSEAGGLQLFEAVRKFAKETPFELGETADAVNRLQKAGIELSDTFMKAFGDWVASKPEKSMKQGAMALEDALQGNFRRLREFDIRVQKHGDNVTAIFRGQRTTFRQTREEWQKYMLVVGQAKGIGGQMEERMKTLGGQTSLLKDSIWQLATVIGEEGFNGQAMTAIQLTTGWTDALIQNRGQLGLWVRFIGAVTKFIAGNLKDTVLLAWEAGRALGVGFGAGFALIQELGAPIFDWMRRQTNSLIRGINKVFGTSFELEMEDTAAESRHLLTIYENEARVRLGRIHELAGRISERTAEVLVTGQDLTSGNARRAVDVPPSWRGPGLDPSDAPEGDGDSSRARRERENAVERLAERARIAARIREITQRDLATIDEVTGKVKDAVEGVLKLDEEIDKIEDDIRKSGGRDNAPKAILDQLTRLQQLRDQKLATAKDVAALPENWLSNDAREASKAFAEARAEMEMLAGYGLRSLEDAPQAFRDALAATQEWDEKIREVQEDLDKLRDDTSAEVIPVRTEGQKLLAHYEAQRKAAAETAASLGSIQQLMQELEGVTLELVEDVGVEKIVAAKHQLEAYVAAVHRRRDAEDALARTSASLDPRDRIAAQRELDRANQALAISTRAVEDALRAQGVEGQKLLEIMDALNQEGGAEGVLNSISAAFQPFAPAAKALEDLAGAVSTVAKELGLLDDQSASALEGVIGLASGIGRIAAGDVLGGGVQALQGGIQLAMGLFGPNKEAAQRHVEQMRAMRSLTEAMDRLRERAVTDVSREQAERDQASVDRLADLLEDNRHSESSRDYVRRRALAQTAVGMGLIDSDDNKAAAIESLRAFVEGLEQQYQLTAGTLTRHVDASDPLGLANALREFGIELENLNLSGFGRDLSGQLDALNWSFERAGDLIGGAAEKMNMFLDVLRRTPDGAAFADQLQAVLAAQGVEGAQTWLQQIARDYATGGVDAVSGMFGEGLDAATIQRLLEEAMARVGEMGEEVSGSTGSANQVNSITAAQANVIQAYLGTGVRIARDQLDVQNAILAELRGRGGALGIPATAYAPPELLAAPPIQISFAAGAFQTPVAASVSTVAEAETLGRTVAAAHGDELLRVLERALEDKKRTRGRSDSPLLTLLKSST